ncbi:competence type IV pilus minor pilin ComGF [Sporosarcina sp. CAU 1771]
MCRLDKRLADGGYTFIESLFQLLILAVFAQFFLLFFFWKAPIEQKYSELSALDWELFAVDMQQLLSDVEEISVFPNRRGITLLNERGVIIIEQGTAVIRKRVYGKGYVPFLTNVHSVRFSLDGFVLLADVTLLDGTKRERGFTVGIYAK